MLKRKDNDSAHLKETGYKNANLVNEDLDMLSYLVLANNGNLLKYFFVKCRDMYTHIGSHARILL